MDVRISIGTVKRRVPGPTQLNGATVEINASVSPSLAARIHRLVLEHTHGTMGTSTDTLWLDPRNRLVGYADEVIALHVRVFTRPDVEEQLRHYRAIGPNVQRKTGVHMKGNIRLTMVGEDLTGVFSTHG